MASRTFLMSLTLLAGAASSAPTWSATPSFDCGKVETGSIESLVCSNQELSALDRRLSGVYDTARMKAADGLARLVAEQRGWIKGRDECWKSEDRPGCVRREYEERISVLQAQYRLVESTGPVRYVCNGDPRNEVLATYFKSDHPTLIAERGDSVSIMFLQPSGSGARYQGRNESLWEHQGEASISWGYGAPEMRCRLQQ